MKTLSTVILAVVSAIVIPTSATAKTWHIKPDGTGDVPTIQAGVDSAASGDTLLLAPGTYTGTGNRNIWIEHKDVSVISEAGAASTIIDCENLQRAIYISWDVTNATVISGLTIENGADGFHGGAIMCNYGAWPRIENNIIRNCTAIQNGGGIFSSVDCNPDITNNLITGCAAERGGGIYMSRCWSNAWIGFNVITGNTATVAGGGMYLYYSWPRIFNNTVCENDAPSGAGLFLTNEDSHPEIDNTIIAFNTTGEGITCDLGALPQLGCCDIYGNAGGDMMCGLDAGNNFSADPQFCADAGDGGCRLWDTSPCALENSPCAMLIGARTVGCEATGIDHEVPAADAVRLMPNYPNPFNSGTTIRYAVPAADVRVAVFDVGGRLVKVLRDERQGRGEHHVGWDGRGHDGKAVAGGVYFVRLEAAGQSRTQKILLLK